MIKNKVAFGIGSLGIQLTVPNKKFKIQKFKNQILSFRIDSSINYSMLFLKTLNAPRSSW
jgi:hypothetical protein